MDGNDEDYIEEDREIEGQSPFKIGISNSALISMYK